MENNEVLPSEPGRVARVEEIIKWNQTHALPGAPVGMPVMGFGPDGLHTLWLASPKRDSRKVIRGGKLVVEIVESAMTTAPMLSLMTATLLRMADASDALHALTEYAVAVISLSYRVDDVDLTYLLAGDRWHQPVVHHLLGDEKRIAYLLGLPTAHRQNDGVIPPTPTAAPESHQTLPTRRGLWRRILRRSPR